MVKVIVLLTRRHDISREDFERYLRETHLPLVVRIPGIQRLIMNLVLSDPNGPALDYDAIVEHWFDDAQAMESGFASPEATAIFDDIPNFLDLSRFKIMVTKEEDVPLSSYEGVRKELHRPDASDR